MSPGTKLQEPNSLPVSLPDYFNIGFDIVDAAADAERNRLALICPDGARSLTYWELSAGSNRIANALRDLGVRGGERVLLAARRGPEWWLAALGIIKRGAVLIPAGPDGSALAALLDATQPQMIVADAESAPTIAASGLAAPLRATIGALDAAALDGWHDLSALASTRPAVLERFGFDEMTEPGDPMMICRVADEAVRYAVHGHGYALAQQGDAVNWLGLTRTDIHWTLTPDWTRYVWCSLFAPLMAGATAFVSEPTGPLDPAAAFALIERHGVTSFCSTPNFYRALVTAPMNDYDLSTLRECTVAGPALDAATAEAWKDGTQGLSVRPAYGSPETPVLIACAPGMAARPGVYGVPTPGYRIGLLDAAGSIVDEGDAEGRIAVRFFPERPPGLALEWLGAEGLFVDDWFVTPDRAVRFDGVYCAPEPAEIPSGIAYSLLPP